jgi:hypothetical protein
MVEPNIELSTESVVELGVDEDDDSIVEPKIEPSAESVVELRGDEDDDSKRAPVTEVGGDARSTEQGALDVDSEADSDFEPEVDSEVHAEVAMEGDDETNIEKGIKLDDEPKIASDSDIADETRGEHTQTPVKESTITTPDSGSFRNEESPENSETTAQTAPPKPGSLASFFKQVSEKEKEREEDRSSSEADRQEGDAKTGKVVEDVLRTSTTMVPGSIIGESLTMQNNADRSEPTGEQDTGIASSIEHRDLTAPSELSKRGGNSEEEDRAYGYTAVWGRQPKHTANKHLLYEVAQKNAAIGTSQDADENVYAEDNNARVVSPGVDDNDADSPEAVEEKDPRIPLRKSVNTQFVEGLDDINKFLEEVEPPDELDVGAAGSSLQEVLIGQGAQILLKRVTIIFSRVKQSFGATRIKQFFASRRTADGEFALFTREELERAGHRVWKGCRSAAGKVHEMWEDLFDDEDSMQFEVEATKLDSIRHRLLDENRHSPSDRRGSERHFAAATNKGELD